MNAIIFMGPCYRIAIQDQAIGTFLQSKLIDFWSGRVARQGQTKTALPYYIIHCPDEDFDKVAIECRDKGVTEMEAIGLMGLKEKLHKNSKYNELDCGGDGDNEGNNRKDPIVLE